MDRPEFLTHIYKAFQIHPIVGLLGPRQCGKTTLARMYATQRGKSFGFVTHFDLEDPTDLAKLENPKLVLESLTGLVIIDEVQRKPELFPILRVLVDRPGQANKKTKFLILGSVSRDLLQQSSESLAGRIQFLELTPFSLEEVGSDHLQRLWLRGGFPRSFLAHNVGQSLAWRKSFIANYLERDIPSLGIQIPPASLRRFWMMLLHYHGQIFNASEIGTSLGLADTTVRRYLDILSGTFMIRQLYGWVENIKKRQVKSPKVFFRDSGIFHSLLGISNHHNILNHPKLGVSWEGFALEEMIRFHKASSEEVYFWSTHNKAELDLLILKDGKRLGYEIKFTSSPKMTKSMHIAMKDLNLSSLTVVYPGVDSFSLGKNVRAVGFYNLQGLE